MADLLSPAPAPPPPPTLPAFPPPDEAEAKKAGCLKFGLIGCAGLSLVLIVALVFVATRGLDTTLSAQRQQTEDAFGGDVTPEDREAFRRAWEAFGAKAKAGKVTFDAMTGFQGKRLDALRDRSISHDELAGLVAELEKASK